MLAVLLSRRRRNLLVAARSWRVGGGGGGGHLDESWPVKWRWIFYSSWNEEVSSQPSGSNPAAWLLLGWCLICKRSICSCWKWMMPVTQQLLTTSLGPFFDLYKKCLGIAWNSGTHEVPAFNSCLDVTSLILLSNVTCMCLQVVHTDYPTASARCLACSLPN